jgi:phage terminase large subunit-like protein
LQNDEWFGLISGLDVCEKCEKEGKTVPQDGCPDCDNWKDEKVWIKASPNIEYLGKPYKDYYRRQVEEAKAMPAQENIVKRLNFNIWTEGITKWISSDAWNACADYSLRIEDFAGEHCYLAFDLANKIDISALMIVFNRDNELYAFGRYYLPEETVTRSKIVQYRQWVREGRIIVTPGAMTDYKYIEDDIKKINESNLIEELAFDPHEATYLVNNLMGWLGEDRCIQINQGPANISEPMKQLEGLVYDKKIHHNGDPVLAWMISNVVKKESRSGGPIKSYYPTKTCEDNKIDGAMALIMGVGRATLQQGPENSIYNELTYEQIKERMAL